MRKPRDIDSELKALANKARQLKERRVRQLGELVITTAEAPMSGAMTRVRATPIAKANAKTVAK